MTIAKHAELRDAIAECVASMRKSALIITMDRLRHTFKELYPHVWNEHAEELEDAGFGVYARDAIKSPDNSDSSEAKQMLLDLGIDDFDPPEHIAVPKDARSLLGAAEWVKFTDCTIEQAQLNIRMLRTRAAADLNQADNMTRLVQAAIRRVGDPASPLTLKQISELA